MVSLRPRKAGSAECPLLPPPSVLRALHRTLPVDPTPGWKGTLSKDNEVAYRDNSTITAGTTPYVNPTPAPQVSTPAPAAKATTAPHYPSYPQAYHQRPGLPATTSSYYNTTTPHPYYAQYKAPGTPTGGAGYYYNYPQYATYAAQYGYPPQAQATTPTTSSRAIPNVAKPAPPYVNGWATPGAATLPQQLRKTTPGQASPAYPPNFSGGYPGYPGYTIQKA